LKVFDRLTSIYALTRSAELLATTVSSYFTREAFLIRSTSALRFAKVSSNHHSDVVVDIEVFRSIHILIPGKCAVFHLDIIVFQSSLDSPS
jgi:hypothetical protein